MSGRAGNHLLQTLYLLTERGEREFKKDINNKQGASRNTETLQLENAVLPE